MNNNAIQEKSYIFALKSVQLYKFLITEQKEFILSKQYLRSATSVGANVEEAIGGQTNKDFFCKMTIAYKEARESRYWLNLLHDSGYIVQESFNELESLCIEICRILSAIQVTMKTKYADIK